MIRIGKGKLIKINFFFLNFDENLAVGRGRARPLGREEDGVQAGTRETQGSAGSSQGSLPAARHLWRQEFLFPFQSWIRPADDCLPETSPEKFGKELKQRTLFQHVGFRQRRYPENNRTEPGKQLGAAQGWGDSQKSPPPYPRRTQGQVAAISPVFRH